MSIVLEIIIIVVSIIGVPLYILVRSRNRCVWWWDVDENCWRTQCRSDARFIGYTEREAWRLRDTPCPFCKKTTVI